MSAAIETKAPAKKSGFTIVPEPIAEPKPAPVIAPELFTPDPPDRVDSNLAHRAAVLVRIAHIGANTILGIVTNEDESGEDSVIRYGLCPVKRTRDLEAGLRDTLGRVFDDGKQFISVTRAYLWGGRKDLVWLFQEYRDTSLKTIKQDLSCFPKSWVSGMNQHLEQAIAMRKRTLSLRQKWDINDAVNKNDVPAWLPRWGLDLVLESPSYRALASATAEESTSTPRTR